MRNEVGLGSNCSDLWYHFLLAGEIELSRVDFFFVRPRIVDFNKSSLNLG